MSADSHMRRQTPLALDLKTRIRRDGPLSVRDYMAACLYDPQHGYYRTQPAIGQAGDFVTAPEISQIFGELIGLWCAVVWRQMGAPAAVDLVELGPGRGTLMRDALRATRGVPGFGAAVRVSLVESSDTLTVLQRATLADARVPSAWRTTLDDIARDSTTPAILIANEVLDCEPRDQFVRRRDGWSLRMIGLDAADQLAFQATDTPTPMPDLDAIYPDARDGDIAEPSRFDLVHQAIAMRPTLAALMIDYGHTAPGLGDTLQAVRRHQPEHPLASPGEADLTMQVDFSALARDVGHIPGVRMDGPVPQAEFLGSLGAVERASRLMAANPARAAMLEAGVARLLSPGGMGTRFQAVGIRAARLPPLPGFPDPGLDKK